jgi:hypothetical protein
MGGVAGMARRPLLVDTKAVDPARATELLALAERARVFERPSSLGRAELADEMGYELLVTEGDRRASVEFGFKDADEPLKALIQALRRA